jgi:hypothetical protein
LGGLQLLAAAHFFRLDELLHAVDGLAVVLQLGDEAPGPRYHILLATSGRHGPCLYLYRYAVISHFF